MFIISELRQCSTSPREHQKTAQVFAVTMDPGAELSIFFVKSYLVMSGFQVKKKKSSLVA
jgi:hypothetical protein